MWGRAKKSNYRFNGEKSFVLSSLLSSFSTHHRYQDPDTGLFQQQRLGAVMIAVEQTEGGMRNRIDRGCTKKQQFRKAKIRHKLQCCTFLTRTFCRMCRGFKLLKEARLDITFKLLKEVRLRIVTSFTRSRFASLTTMSETKKIADVTSTPPSAALVSAAVSPHLTRPIFHR